MEIQFTRSIYYGSRQIRVTVVAWREDDGLIDVHDVYETFSDKKENLADVLDNETWNYLTNEAWMLPSWEL